MYSLRGLVGMTETFGDLPKAGLHPERGDFALPVLTLDLVAFENNAKAMFDYARRRGLLLAPHAKTPMSPDLSRRLIEKGAWGLSIADLQQAAVMLEHGFTRLLVANQIGGARSGARFGRLLATYRDAELIFFVDSVESARAVNIAGQAAGRTLAVLIEVGQGRAGARDQHAVRAILAEIAASSHLKAGGIALYEGAAAKSDAGETQAAIARLCGLGREAFAMMRSACPGAELLFSAGGSALFDLVVEHLAPFIEADGKARMILRSGAIFFHDHGVYERAHAQLDARQGFAPTMGQPASTAFTPALRIWAEVLSRPEPDLLICGMGMRDVSSDQDLPRALAFYRDGAALSGLPEATVFKLNDQHAFLRVAASHPARVGDIVTFGISHPCTCIDRWRLILGRNQAGAVTDIFPTFFG